MSELNIEEQCPRCLGVGTEKDSEGIDIACTACNGLKHYVKDRIDVTTLMEKFDDMDDKLNDIADKLDDIKELVEE